MLARLWLVVTLFVLAGCSGDGGDGNPVTPASGLSYPAAPTLVVGQPNDPAPNISYSQSQVDLTSGVPVTFAAQNSGGAVTLWAIDPALPAGLSFDTSNGTISGSPNAASAPAQYTVTAQNSGGSDTFSLTIGVNSGVLLKLGHGQAIRSIAQSAGRVLSLDDYGFWTLWNSQTAGIIAGGRAECNLTSCGALADLKGSTFIIRHAATTSGPWLFEVRSASDGQLLSTFTKTASAELATDGSYVAIRGSDNLTVQSPTGTVLFSRNGDYFAGRVFVTPTEIRVAAGPAGANTIEKISVPAGIASTSAPFQGEFHSWFVDGERFLTNTGSTIWVYSHDVQQVDLRALPGIERLTGQGDWFWIYRFDTLSIYSVGASASPAASYSIFAPVNFVPVGDTIGVLPRNGGQFSVIDLSAASPVRIDRTASIRIPATFAVGDDGWLLGNHLGSLVGVPSSGGSERRFSLGATSSIVASDNRIVVGLVEGPVIYFDAQTRQEEGRINVSSAELALSSDGTVLATRPGGPTVKIYSLPSGSEIETLTYPWYVYYIALSASGQHIAAVTHERLSDRREVSAVGTGGAVLFSDTGKEPPLKLSPTGLIAAPNFFPNPFQALTTNIYQGNSLTGAVGGYPVVWLDDTRLLAHRYNATSENGTPIYSDSVIVGPTGAVSQTLVFTPPFTDADPVDGQNIYVPEHNIILSLTTGQTVWSSVNTVPRGLDRSKRGAVTDTDVVFAAGSDVRIEPY